MLFGRRQGCPDWSTNIGATDQPFNSAPITPVRFSPNGNSYTPDAAIRCLRWVQYGPSCSTAVIGSMKAFSAPPSSPSGADCVQPAAAPICVYLGIQV